MVYIQYCWNRCSRLLVEYHPPAYRNLRFVSLSPSLCCLLIDVVSLHVLRHWLWWLSCLLSSTVLVLCELQPWSAQNSLDPGSVISSKEVSSVLMGTSSSLWCISDNCTLSTAIWWVGTRVLLCVVELQAEHDWAAKSSFSQTWALFCLPVASAVEFQLWKFLLIQYDNYLFVFSCCLWKHVVLCNAFTFSLYLISTILRLPSLRLCIQKPLHMATFKIISAFCTA